MKLKNLKNSYLNKTSDEEELKQIKSQIVFKPQKRYLPYLSYALSGIFLIVIVVLLCVIFIDTARVTFLAMSLSKNESTKLKASPTSAVSTSVKNFDYYLDPNEEVVINIELANDKQFEILSVEINQVVYPNYTFLTGSDIDTIYLNYQCSNESGPNLIYINSIKYVDGTSIKECDFAGNRELSIAISYPTPKIDELANLQITSERISFMIGTNYLEQYANLATVYCYYEDNLVASLALESPTYNFTELLPGQDYQIIIKGEFDLYDGSGLKEYILFANTYQTALPFVYSLSISTNSINISCDYPVQVYLNGNEVGKNITGLSPNTPYYLELRYTYNNEELSTILGPITTKSSAFTNVSLTSLTNGYLLTFKKPEELEITNIIINDSTIISNFTIVNNEVSLIIADSLLSKITICYTYLNSSYEEVIYHA